MRICFCFKPDQIWQEQREHSVIASRLLMVCVFPYRTSSLPPLDWPLPSQFGQYELKIEVHPKAHHRAHYETEGSRGAVKATSGGHPIVKVTSPSVYLTREI